MIQFEQEQHTRTKSESRVEGGKRIITQEDVPVYSGLKVTGTLVELSDVFNARTGLQTVYDTLVRCMPHIEDLTLRVTCDVEESEQPIRNIEAALNTLEEVIKRDNTRYYDQTTDFAISSSGAQVSGRLDPSAEFENYTDPNAFAMGIAPHADIQIFCPKFFEKGQFSPGYRVFQELARLDDTLSFEHDRKSKVTVHYVYRATPLVREARRELPEEPNGRKTITLTPPEAITNGLEDTPCYFGDFGTLDRAGELGKKGFARGKESNYVSPCGFVTRDASKAFEEPNLLRMAMFYPDQWEQIEPALTRPEAPVLNDGQASRFKGFLGKLASYVRR